MGCRFKLLGRFPGINVSAANVSAVAGVSSMAEEGPPRRSRK
jgi:hypothetical protein